MAKEIFFTESAITALWGDDSFSGTRLNRLPEKNLIQPKNKG